MGVRAEPRITVLGMGQKVLHGFGIRPRP